MTEREEFKLEFYQKFYAKLKRISDGDLSLEDYISEVDEKVSALLFQSTPDKFDLALAKVELDSLIKETPAEEVQELGHFDILKDMALNSDLGKLQGFPSRNFVEAKTTKRGGEFTMGISPNALQWFFVNSNDVFPMLYLIDRREYNRVKSKLGVR